MSQTIYCHEPAALPARVSVDIEEGEALALYVLDDEPGRGVTARRTVLRPVRELAPAQAELVFDAELGTSGRYRVLRVRRVGRVPADLFRQDGRTRITVGTEIRSGARLEADPGERETVGFSLSFAATAAQGIRASVGGGGTRASRAAGAHTTLLWLVPSVIQIIRDPLNDIKDGAIEWMGSTGINPRALSAIVVTLITFGATGGFGLMQYFAAQEAQEKLAVAEAEAEASAAAVEAALASEAQCMVDRRALAAAADQRDAERRLMVEGALARAQARTLAEGRGGARFTGDATLPFDDTAWNADVASTMALLDDAAATVEPSAPCRAFTTALERDLPAYVLSTHPDPAQSCPTAYLAIVGGATLRGRWGLSDRVVTELAGPARIADDPQLAGFDPRDVDRASAALLTAGVRAVRKELLSVDVGARPTVAPSELNLWSLALFDAANRLPPTPPGAPVETLAGCVALLVKDRATTSTLAAPGEPVLPDLARVAKGDVLIAPTPTAACPWPDGAIANGARAALRAAARAAVVPPPAVADAAP